MSEWKKYTLADVTTVLGDGLHGTPKYQEDGPVYFINGNNLINGSISLKDATKRVSEEEARKYKKPLNDRTIMVSINGTIGNVAKYNGESCILGKSACYFNVKKEFDKDFIYYVVCNPSFVANINRLATGTTIKNVSLKTMREYSFLAPSLKTQQNISKILSSIDSKIAINRKINENLEQQAQALFKSWFVDFEPFKDGKFVESELGMIPEGWKVGILEGLGAFKRGKVITMKDVENGIIPVVAGGMEPAYYHNISNTKSPVITISASGANAGFCRLYFEDIWASDCSYLDSNNENLYWIYCYLQINKRLLRHAQTGAVQPHVKPKDINSFVIAKPTDKELSAFRQIIKPLFDEISTISKEIKSLSQLRDTLLPRLMSGEINLSD